MSTLRTIACILMVIMTGCQASSLPSQDSTSSGNGNISQSKKHVWVSLLEAELSLHAGCPRATPGHAQCYSVTSTFPVRLAEGNASADGSSCVLNRPPCYGPDALQGAYNVRRAAANDGRGKTIAIVDAYAYPSAAFDLAMYRKVLKLPKLCSECFKVMNEKGGSTPPKESSTSWDGEQAIDIQMASAMCPNCNILLVEANSDSNPDLTLAVSVALKHSNVVSLSWGGSEYAYSSSLYDVHSGSVIVAAAGDDGAGAGQPCSFVGVICVGGTSLKPDASSRRGWHEVVWNGFSVGHGATGSGCSAYITKPSWQHDKGCTMRSESDLSAVADPLTGVVVVNDGVCCYVVGGTSVATPIIAGIYALSSNTKVATPASLWAHAGGKYLNAVLEGDNEDASEGTFICPKNFAYICVAGTETNGVYSGPTGWGTPNGVSAL